MADVTTYAPGTADRGDEPTRRPVWPFAIGAIVLLSAVTILVIPRLHHGGTAPCIRITFPATPQDADAIKTLISHEQDIRIIGLQTLDTSLYSTVYANDPCIPLTGEWSRYLHRVRMRYGTEAGMESDGWLAAEVAQIVDRRGGIGVEQAAHQTATAAEQAGITPVPLGEGSNQTPTPVPQAIATRKIPIRYDEVLADGNRAEIVYNPGGALYRAFLVRTSDGWRIVGLQLIGECCG